MSPYCGTSETAFAKLNLSLDVLGLLPGGYHELLMVMQSISVCDEIKLSLRNDGEIHLSSDKPWLPSNEKNLAWKAAAEFFGALGQNRCGVDITITKTIPVGAGMAGGSSDAAAVLRGLNRLFGKPFDADGLRRIGLLIGSDVPYCITGGSKLARGRGELLTPLPELPECSVVVVKPAFSISTADLFGKVDSRAGHTHPDTAGIVSSLHEMDLRGVAMRMFNVFEDVLPRNCRELSSIRGELLDHGALGAVMTGTGSAVFGIFSSEKTAGAAWSELQGKYRECFLTSFVPELTV